MLEIGTKLPEFELRNTLSNQEFSSEFHDTAGAAAPHERSHP